MALQSPTTLANITVPNYPAVDDGITRLGRDTATWGFYVAYGDCNTFREQVFGLFRGTDGQGNPTVTYRLPMQCPGLPGLLADDIDVTPMWPTGDASNLYQIARVVVDFAPPSYDPDIQYSVEFQAGSDLVTLPGYKVTVSGLPLPGDIDAAIPLSNQTIVVTRHRVPSVSIPDVTAYTDKINSQTFLGRAPGTVRFGGISTRTDYAFLGQGLAEVTMPFIWRAVPWDQVLIAPGQWVTPDQVPFQRVDFTPLIQ